MAKRILLIDDEEDFCELTKAMLEFHDYEVDTYNDPLVLLEKIDQSQYDLIVSDLMMPNLNGFELIDKIREHERYQKTPIIMLTAKTLTDDERKIILKQKIHLILKPFDPHGLVDEIQGLL